MVLAPVGLLLAFFIEKVLLQGHDHAHGAPGVNGDAESSHAHSPAAGSSASSGAGTGAEENGIPLKELPVKTVPVEEIEEISEERKRLHDVDHSGAPVDPAAAAHGKRGQSHADEKNELLPFLLAFVLSIHSVIGGMALGLQNSPEKVTPLFIAILSHKWIEAFALGASILKNSGNFKSFAKISTRWLIWV